MAAIEAEAAATSAPVWGAEIDRIEPGLHPYWFYLDGRKIADPACPYVGKSDRESLFGWPPQTTGNSSGTVPRVLASDRGMFLYEGPIERSLLFIAPFRGEWRGIDEFRPLNDAARANLENILADRSLGAIHGVVVDPDRNPISYARVRALDRIKSGVLIMGSGHLQTVACDDGGRFRIDRLPFVDIAVGAQAPGYARRWHRSPAIKPGAMQALEIILQPAIPVGGTVSDTAGQPVPGALVTVHARRYVDWAAKTVTDEVVMLSTRMIGKLTLVLLCLCLAVPCHGAGVDVRNAQSNALIGWAAVGDGTKGGAGGATYNVSDAKTLRTLVGAADRKVIRVQGVVRLKSDLRIGLNTSLIGAGANAALVEGGGQNHAGDPDDGFG